MSYTRIEAAVGRAREVAAMPQIERVSRMVAWAILNAVLLFAEHAAELAAPFLILGGVIWWAIPQALSAITLDGQANDMLLMVRARVPHEILLGGNYVSASSLIVDGVFCIAIVALCRTAATAITSLLLDRR